MFELSRTFRFCQQVVNGVSPTLSGVHLLRLMAGLLFTSIGSGQAISRWGRYKVLPRLSQPPRWPSACSFYPG